jgi:hypothetical protein
VVTWAIGLFLDRFHKYTPVFLFIGTLRPLAYVIGNWIMGRVERLEIREAQALYNNSMDFS